MTTAANLKMYGSEFSHTYTHTRTQYVFLCTTVINYTLSTVLNIPSSLLLLQRMCVAQSRATCTKATTMFASRSTRNSLLPCNIRHISEPDIKHDYKNRELIGKGTLAKCYLIQMGAMKVCFKQLSADTKYKSLFYRG